MQNIVPYSQKLLDRSKVFLQSKKFVAGATHMDHFPNTDLCEIAFIGKSNVGKSSLINMLCHMKKLARVSKTPGCTKQINFFLVSNQFMLADLPGYGYAKVAVKESQNWEKLILSYLNCRNNLKLIYILIDSRRGIKDNDLTVIELVTKFNQKFQIIFTKEDKISNIEKQKLVTLSKNLLSIMNIHNQFIFTNTRSVDSVQELQCHLLQSIE